MVSPDDIAKPKFMIDGMVHVVGSNECCSPFSKPCECGGILHCEAVFDGEWYKCDKCGRDA